MKDLNCRWSYVHNSFFVCFCLLAQFAWADGSRDNPYIDQVEIVQTDKQIAGGGILQSTTVRVILNSFDRSFGDRITRMELRGVKRGFVYDFASNDLYSDQSGRFYLKEFPFSLADDEIIIIAHDSERGEHIFYVKEPRADIISSGTYDGSWSGKTDQGYNVSFNVSNNKVSDFNIKMKIYGSKCTCTVEQTFYYSESISGGSFSYSGSDSYSSWDYDGTFSSSTVCNGTWYFRDEICKGSDSGTWKTTNGSPPPTTTTTTATTTTTSTTTSTSTTTTTTLPASRPLAITGWATSVTGGSATLTGAVHPNGAETLYHFEYGLTDTYGSVTPGRSAGAGWTPVSAGYPITALDVDTTYHFRIVAENDLGQSLGGDRTLRTTVIFVEPLGSCGGHTPCFTSIQHGMDAAVYGGTIKIASEEYDEDLATAAWGDLVLEGGWDASFISRSPFPPSWNTAITGTVVIGADMEGAVVVDGLALGPRSGSTTYTNSLGQIFVLLPPGTFTMGSPSDELGRDSDEGPQHQVTLTKSFYMQTTEVTQAQWEAVMGSNPSYFLGCPTCPVEQVSWNDVQTFITEMNKRGEGTYSLPTEAQWEYAARAGSITAFYNGGITVTDCSYDPNLDKIGWYCYNSSNKTHPVAQKTQNAWGLYDMSGNVWEWCQDWYSSSYYSSSPGSDPTGPSSGSNRVLRGGGWGSGARGCRSADRNSSTPGSRSSIFGFRLLRQP
jgi:formylglycine-generating enzyme required for sulfatase activity